MLQMFLSFLLLSGVSKVAECFLDTNLEGPKCPFAEPFDEAGGLFEQKYPPMLNIVGSLGDLHAEGLSTVRFKANIDTIGQKAHFEFNIKHTNIVSTWDATGKVDFMPLDADVFPSGPFKGKGPANITIKNLEVKGSVDMSPNPQLFLEGKVAVNSLDLKEFKFESFYLNLGAGFFVNNDIMDWDKWNGGFKQAFDTQFEKHKKEVQNRIKITVNKIIAKYKFTEVVEKISEYSNDDSCKKTKSLRTLKF